MRKYGDDRPTGGAPEPGDRAPTFRRVGVRRLLTVPVAVVGAVAVTLGIAQPADAAPQSVKRQPKAKETRGAPAPRPAMPASTVPSEVVVAQGDTVSAIAERYGLSTAEVLAENGLSWSSLIFPGQRLALPGGAPNFTVESDAGIARHIVAPGDTMIAIAAEYGLDVDVVLSANGLGRASLIFPGQAITIPAGAGAAASVSESTAPVAAVEASSVAALDVRLDDEMRANARIIVEVGRSLGVPDRGIVVALAAAAQESGLRNVRHGDRDSLGLFQQRPSQGWGTPEQVLDPVRAATAFYGGPTTPNEGRTPGLLDVPDWAGMTVTDAAQAVQHSAHPNHYAKWESSARRWLDELG
ncbi:LysM peptidoglycan-binding domain-containing protein [Agromyces bracchium]|uniref:LysM peptidoglycan-binding domain-containing protein n=1 Tax=Agromyces bracchium TaxID=88376 RepID=A0A6I3M5X4_9MICO|nr:LysM domain-containing protein [Agromyces bracchium]MTH68321.1 LysM peptidoglycan-binding domain-containing protein [Agromyces bracchium]